MRQILSPLDGIRSPFGRLLGSVFSPALLFAASEPGVWYDPSDVANLDWRRNLLTWTEQFDNAAWSKSAGSSVVADNSTAPNSTTTADLFRPSTSSAFQSAQQTFTFVQGTTYTWSAYVKASGYNWLRLRIFFNSSACDQLFDLTNGVKGTTANNSTGNTVTSSIASAGSGWYRVVLTCQAPVISGAGNISLNIHDGDNANQMTGNGTSGILLWGAQLETGSTATEYQRITDVNTEVIERFPSATLYQDTAGTTPVTTPGQSVGLALDKSKGLVLGSELVTNGDFSSGTTGWSLTNVTVSGGVATFGSGTGFLAQNNILQIGKTYRVTFTLVTSSAGNDAKFHNSIWSPEVNLSAAPISSNPGTYTLTLRAVSTNFRLDNYSGTGFQVDNISVKELPGFHATQATAGSRPIYGIVPVGGRRNLLTRTEEFNTAPWQKIGAQTVTSDAAVAPNGTTTADKLIPSAVSDLQAVYQGQTFAAATYTVSVYAKAAEYSWLFVRVDGVGNGYVWFNLSNGTIGTQEAGRTGSISSQGNGWYRCAVTWTSTGGTGNVLIGASNANATSVFTGNASNGILIWGAQLETGSTATAYQRVVSQYDVTEAGVSSLSYLAFDTSKFLVTPTITPGIDRAQVFAGVRKNSDAARGMVFEHTAGTTGRVSLEAPGTTAATYVGQSGGTTLVSTASAASFSAPDTTVLTVIGDIAGDNLALRRNGTQIAQTSSDQGAGNYTSAAAYIGMRGGSTLPLNGNIFSLIVRFGANLTADQITSTETWVNSKTRAY
jgi:hypothetical protein